ncbi:hypothetical protein AB0P15_32425 [Streptomyces sp. NPDC087917]|uniref:hypothetical protein n=1 Tax=Streptomyces sp. NPDC087917 TaxID=3155060 RepID=UPI003423D681
MVASAAPSPKGATALVARWLAVTGAAEDRIVVVFPDGPQRYTGSVFSDAYCRAHDLLLDAAPEQPQQITHPGQRTVISWTRCTSVTDPLADPDPGPDADADAELVRLTDDDAADGLTAVAG